MVCHSAGSHLIATCSGRALAPRHQLGNLSGSGCLCNCSGSSDLVCTPAHQVRHGLFGTHMLVSSQCLRDFELRAAGPSSSALEAAVTASRDGFCRWGSARVARQLRLLAAGGHVGHPVALSGPIVVLSIALRIYLLFSHSAPRLVVTEELLAQA